MRRIYPSSIRGEISVPSSKSIGHRALVCAALCDRETTVYGDLTNGDIEATKKCLCNLGARFNEDNGRILIKPVKVADSDKIGRVPMDAGDSGSTLRFMLSIAAALNVMAQFTGTKRLSERPLTELTRILRMHGVKISGDKIPLTVEGKLTGGRFDFSDAVSSQYASGVMMAAPLTGDDCTVTVSATSSKSYIDLTSSVMSAFGAEVKNINDDYKIKKGARYISPLSYSVEGDWSGAAFYAAGGALTGKVTITNVNENSRQGDMEIVRVLKEAGAAVYFSSKGLTVEKSRLSAVNFNAENCPDIVPIAAVMLGAAKGISVISGVGRLKYKESDRLSETIKLLKEFGISSESDGEKLVIYGGKLTGGGKIELPDDHRIAMAAAIAAAAADAPTKIVNWQCVEKSYPRFFNDFEELGGKTSV